MSLLSYEDLVGLVNDGVIDADLSRINGSSIDLTLDDVIRVEDEPRYNKVVNLAARESIETREYIMSAQFGYQMLPGEFILGSSREKFRLPDNISAEYKLKSTLARNGLEHLSAGWIDAGFFGKLTLELINCTKKHNLVLSPGLPIGQVVFYEHKPVPDGASYRTRGQYNGQSKVTASKGVR